MVSRIELPCSELKIWLMQDRSVVPPKRVGQKEVRSGHLHSVTL